jgi:hypothetical protein
MLGLSRPGLLIGLAYLGFVGLGVRGLAEHAVAGRLHGRGAWRRPVGIRGPRRRPRRGGGRGGYGGRCVLGRVDGLPALLGFLAQGFGLDVIVPTLVVAALLQLASYLV